MKLEIISNLIILRPYVVLFLATYLGLGIAVKGWRWTLAFFAAGYGIAWCSEALSIRTGFPYGFYHYMYENLRGEGLIFGVPLWDSASYVFLTFAGLGVAKKIGPKLSPLKLCLTAAALTTLLDIIIDPLALRGDQWFLGQIYYYPNPGPYFDVPFTNFAGWFFVTFLIALAGHGLETVLPPPRTQKMPQIMQHGPILLYFGIFGFNWAITLSIGLWWLALADLFWISLPGLLLWRVRTRSSPANT